MNKDEIAKEIKDTEEKLAKLRKQLEKPECDFLPGQVLKVWNNHSEDWDIDVFGKYDKAAEYSFVCRRFDWKHAEPLPLKNLIACIAYYMPNAVKAVANPKGVLYFYGSHNGSEVGCLDGNFRIPYPNNTGKDIIIDIER